MNAPKGGRCSEFRLSGRLCWSRARMFGSSAPAIERMESSSLPVDSTAQCSRVILDCPHCLAGNGNAPAACASARLQIAILHPIMNFVPNLCRNAEDAVLLLSPERVHRKYVVRWSMVPADFNAGFQRMEAFRDGRSLNLPPGQGFTAQRRSASFRASVTPRSENVSLTSVPRRDVAVIAALNPLFMASTTLPSSSAEGGQAHSLSASVAPTISL